MRGTIPHPTVRLGHVAWFCKPLEMVIYTMIFPLVFLDVSMAVYQSIYFSLRNIPKVHRRDYIIVDRGRLKGLNLLQRINCMYCDYANGVIAWVKDVINVTELYSCAIKHSAPRKGQEHQETFESYEKFLSVSK